jgi:hypothetical protein
LDTEPDELDRIDQIECRIERAIAYARWFGKREGWSETQIFNDAWTRLNMQRTRWDSVHQNWGAAWNGWVRDWHKLRSHFMHLPDFRRPSETFPYPTGTYERTLRAWLEREIEWADEWRRAELFAMIHGGPHVLH